METRALVLRVIPYSDRMKIIQCLTDSAGLQSYSVSISSKSNNSAMAQTGKFIQFSTPLRANKLPRVKDMHLDPTMNQIQIGPQHLSVWFFTLELISKSTAEGFHIPGFRETIDRYYTQLCSDQVSTSPLIPLMLLAATLGTEDIEKARAPSFIADSMRKLGHELIIDNDVRAEEMLETMTRRFQNHFNIFSLDSLELLS